MMMSLMRCLLALIMAGMFVPVASVHAADEKPALILDAALDRVDITTGFDGAKLVVYGVKRVDGELAVVVKGPEKYKTVRKKGQIMGIWMNVQSIEFENVTSYYDYALSDNENNLAEVEVLRESGVGLNAMHFVPDDEGENPAEVSVFHEALIRLRQSSGLLPLEAQSVRYLDDGFFKVVFDLPANVPMGLYRIEGHVFRDGAVVESDVVDLKVGQVGLSADVYQFAHLHPWFYAFVILFAAGFSGLAAHYIMRKS